MEKSSWRLSAEIQYAWSRIGPPEVATDRMGVELSDIFISLTPRAQWKGEDSG